MKLGIKTNLDLSSRRADAVVDYLRAHGIDPKILSAKGRGETHPVAPNNTPAGRAQNRRIEIVVEGPAS
jgi:outer membrane protein OmpA-like peptidoglycan-associated protein